MRSKLKTRRGGGSQGSLKINIFPVFAIVIVAF